MNILIVHAHPEEKSFCSLLKGTAVEFFIKLNEEVIVSGLYKMNFNPVGSKNDFIETSDKEFFKYQLEQVNAFNKNLFVQEIKTEMDKFFKADVVIFNFSLWWFSVTAILKGWVDRVFAMGFAYGAGKGVYDSGAFKNKKSLLLFNYRGTGNCLWSFRQKWKS